jgi:rhamnosyltransferase
MNTLRVSIVIRCLNEERHLPRLLEGIASQTLKASEIIVVDSGSTDRTVEIATAGGARVVHIRPGEFTFGRSLNLGARVSSGDILVMASAHTYPVSRTWLESMIRPFEDSDVALVYGGQRGDERSKFSERQLFKQWFPEQNCSDQKHPFSNNANAAVRRLVWSTLPYDEDVPALEDIHWTKRALDRGMKVVYVAGAAIVHVHEESYGKIHGRYRREGMGMQMIFPWERMSLFQALSLAFNAIVSDLKQARRDRVLSSVAGSILMFRLAQYLGTYRGLNQKGAFDSDLRARFYYPKDYRTRTEPASREEAAPEKHAD